MEKGKFDLTYYKFISVSHRVEKQIKQALKAYQLTHSQLNVLHLLYRKSPNALNVKDIKAKMVVNQPDITRLIDRLVQKGLVERAICEENRTKIDIRLTEKGAVIFKSAHENCKKAVGNFFEDFLTPEESEELFKILIKLRL